MNLAQATLSPGTDGHPLGTDASGYDVLRRLMVAGQISLEVGIAAALLATLVGVLWGAIAGYFGGALETASGAHRGVDAGLQTLSWRWWWSPDQGGHPAHRPHAVGTIMVNAIVSPTDPSSILISGDRTDVVAHRTAAGPRREAVSASASSSQLTGQSRED